MEPEDFAAVMDAKLALRRARAAELLVLDLDHVARFGRHVDAVEDSEARPASECHRRVEPHPDGRVARRSADALRRRTPAALHRATQ